MEERKGEYCEPGVPSSASAYLRLLFLIRFNATNRGSNGRLRFAVVLMRPYWFVTVSSLSIYWCSYAFFLNVWFRPVF